MTYLELGESDEVTLKDRFRGFDWGGKMPQSYGPVEIVGARSLTEYSDRKEALNRCEGAVYEVETIHRIKRIK